MPQTRFEKAIHVEMERCVTALLTHKSTDPEIARIQGKYAALVDTLKLHRDETRIDDDEDVA